MKKLYCFFLTILFFCITFSGSCFAIANAKTPLTISNISSQVFYTDNDGSYSVTLNNPTLLEDFLYISAIETNFIMPGSSLSDYVYFNGEWTFYSAPGVDTSSSSNFDYVSDLLPSSLPAPTFSTSDTSSPVYCEYISITMDKQLPSMLVSSSATVYLFNHFNYTVKCPVNDVHLEDSSFKLNWKLNYPIADTDSFTVGIRNLGFFSSLDSHAYLFESSSSVDDILSFIEDIKTEAINISDRLENIDSFMSDDDIDSAVLGADSFFNQSDTELTTFGLADFVSAGINFIKAIRLDYACVPLQLPAILGTQITLPCFTEWLHNFNENIYNLYHLILTFYIGYLICCDLIRFIHNLRDPQNDNITVLEI